MAAVMDMDVNTEGRFTRALNEGMEKKNMDIRTLSRVTGVTYEHIRKLVRGLAQPSVWMVHQIAKALELDEEELAKAAVADRIETKFGATAALLGGKDPESLPVMRRWKSLNEEQKRMVTAMMDGLLAQNQSHHAPSKKRRA